MIIGIIGSRRRASTPDFVLLKRRLKKLVTKRNIRGKLSDIDKIVTGDCETGGDNFARIIAKNNGIECDVKYKKDLFTGEKWEQQLDKDGKVVRVGHKAFTQMCYNRNEEIAKENLDYLFCLVARDRTGGTENTIEKFKEFHYDWEEKLILV